MACPLFNQSFLIGAESGNLVFTGAVQTGNPVRTQIADILIPPWNYGPIYVIDKTSGLNIKCNFTGNTSGQYRQERVASSQESLATWGLCLIRWGCTIDIPTELRDKVIADPNQSYDDQAAENVSFNFYDTTQSGSIRYYSVFSMFPLIKRIRTRRYDVYGSFIEETQRYLMINAPNNYSEIQPVSAPEVSASVSYGLQNNVGYFNYRIEIIDGFEFHTRSYGVYPVNLPLMP